MVPADLQDSGQEAFANVNNLEHCLKYINQSLVAYGFPAPLELATQDAVSVARTCNSLYALLQQRQQDVSFREEANEQKHRLCSDLSRLESKVERLEGHLAAKERELAGMVAKEQKMTSTFKAQVDKLQQERDEFQRMIIGTQQVRTQQLHELKKKEKEFIKLQERLNQVLADKKKETKPGMEIMSLLQKEGRQRGTWNNKKADGDFYKMIVDTYETKQQELVTENAELRALLRSTQADMKELLNKGMITSEADYDIDTRSCLGNADVFDLPLHLARGQIEESLRSKLNMIKEYIVQRQGDVPHELPDPTDRELELEAQLVEARTIIEGQAYSQSKKTGSCNERDIILDSNWSALQEMSLQLDQECLEAKERLKSAKLVREMDASPDKVFRELQPNAEVVRRRESHGARHLSSECTIKYGPP